MIRLRSFAWQPTNQHKQPTGPTFTELELGQRYRDTNRRENLTTFWIGTGSRSWIRRPRRPLGVRLGSRRRCTCGGGRAFDRSFSLCCNIDSLSTLSVLFSLVSTPFSFSFSFSLACFLPSSVPRCRRTLKLTWPDGRTDSPTVRPYQRGQRLAKESGGTKRLMRS